MALILIGINHKTASLEVREKISFTSRQLACAFTQLKQSGILDGIAILSTCNRAEIYAESQDADLAGQIIKRFLFDQFEVKEADIKRYFYIAQDADVVRHIYRVASGLDSQVLGELQILGQVKSALALASDSCAASPMLNELFKDAVRVGKLVRLKTHISKGNVSVGSAAINMLEKQFKGLKGKSALIVGAGKIANLISKYLLEKKMQGIFVSNRTFQKACELAAACNGTAVNFSQLKEKLEAVDIVISSTSSPHLIIKKDMLSEIMHKRKKPLFIMDLALPRDVDPQAKGIPGVHLFDLDDLKGVIEKNFNLRKSEAAKAEKIAERELECCPYFSATSLT